MLGKEAKQFIAKSRVFADLTAAEQETLVHFMHEVQFPAKTMIIRQGIPDGGLYIIHKGRVEVSVRLPGDVKSKIAELSANDFFGEITLIEGGPPSAYVTTLESTLCYFLDRSAFNALRVSNPDIAYKISLVIATMVTERLRDVNHRVGGHLDDIKRLPPYRSTSRGKPVIIQPNDINFIKELDIFQDLSNDELQQLLTYMRFYSFPKDSILFREGDASDCFFVIIQGAVLVLLERDDKISKLSVLGPGESFGIMSFIAKGNRSATCIVREDALLLKASVVDIYRLIQEDRFLYYKIFAAVSRNLVAVLRKADKLLIRLEVETRE